MTKKRVFISALVALLAVVAIGGTLAYLTDKDEVENTFTVGDVKITLDEARVNDNGQPVKTENGSLVVVQQLEDADRVDANTYKLIPGHSYTKDPTVTVAKGSETSYVRVLVTVNKVGELTEMFGGEFKLETVFTGYDSAWVRHSITPNDDNTVTYEYWYKDTVTTTAESETKLPALFTGITLPGTITNAQLATLQGEGDHNGLTLTIVAHAIQADGFNDAGAAWAVFTEK